jgi:hypothetical protein
MGTIKMLAAVICLSPAIAAAALELKGITPGMTQAEVVKRGNISGCVLLDAPPSLDKCLYLNHLGWEEAPLLNTLAERPVKSWEFEFVDAILYRTLVHFSHDHYDKIRDAFVVKYGRPKSARAESFQNHFGAQFTGDVLEWGEGDTVMALREFTTSRDVSALVMTRRRGTCHRGAEKHSRRRHTVERGPLDQINKRSTARLPERAFLSSL